MRSSRLEVRRLKLLNASLRIFAQKGFHGAAIGDIADASNVGHSTFYGYFPNKTKIFKALVDHIYARIVAVLLDEAFDKSETLEDYRAQIGRIGDRLFALFQKEPDLAQVIFYESWAAGGEIARLSEEAFEALMLMTQEYLDHGVTRGYLKSDFDTKVAAKAINAMLFESIKSVLRNERPEIEYAAWKGIIPLMMLEGLALPR